LLRCVTCSHEELRNKKEEITMRKARLKSFVHVMRTGIRKSGLHLIRPICRKQIAHLPLEGKAYSVVKCRWELTIRLWDQVNRKMILAWCNQARSIGTIHPSAYADTFLSQRKANTWFC